ncbi:LysR family transcriptional regulator [Streptomyces sp. NPDC060322]|uniref:LysR family transcriptional regulator n=1 Tax=unclassified Streptomyces TaxID=2593676 RepID=UPI00365C5404
MNLARLDLNLVVALRALLEERNVTRAGQRIGLSQPAMSASLARLRRHFGDDLLARVGGHYELTALGQVLLQRTSTAYEVVERLFASQADFDPGSEKREFKLVASDYAVAVFGAELARVIHEEAPGIRLRFTQTPPTVVDDTATLLSTADGLLMPHGVISDFPATDLYEDEWVFLVADDHPSVDDRLTLGDLGRLPWVTYQRTYDAPAVRQLGMLGIEPRVEVSVDSFQLLPLLVAGTRRIALIQARLARLLAPLAAVRMVEPPYEAVPLREAMWWHPVHTHDAAHIWLRETTARVGRRMADVPEAPAAH